MNPAARRALLSLRSFAALAFGLSWACWLPVILLRQNPLNTAFLLLYALGLCGPSLAALFLAREEGGAPALKALLRRALELDFGRAWWAAILLAWPLLFGLAAFLASRIGSSPYPYSPLWKVFDASPWLFLPQLLASFLAGPLSEQYGWRGRALDALEADLGKPWSALALGLAAWLWQLPLSWMVGTLQSNLSLPLSLLHLLAQAFLLNAVYHGARRSLGAVILFHFTYNLTLGFIPLLDPITFAFLTALETLLAISIALYWVKKGRAPA